MNVVPLRRRVTSALDRDLDDLLDLQRRLAVRRSCLLAVAGLVAGACGSAMIFWGLTVDVVQAGAEQQFHLPGYAQIVGLLLVLGGLSIAGIGLRAALIWRQRFRERR